VWIDRGSKKHRINEREKRNKYRDNIGTMIKPKATGRYRNDKKKRLGVV
jgi:hypothetical protein